MKTINTKIAISFDDGRQDNVDVIDRLAAKGIPASLYVTTGYVDGSCPQDKLPTAIPAMSVDDVKRLFHNPLVEIGMHGDMHLNEDWDIRNGREKLLKWLDLDTSYQFGFASPSTSYSVERFLNSNAPLFTHEIAYLAMGQRRVTHAKVRTIARKGSRVIHSGILYKTAYQDTLMLDCPDRVIYRVPVLGDITFEQLRTLVEDAVRRRASLVFMFHSIADCEDTWTWSNEKFEQLIDYLEALKERQRIELTTVRDLHAFLSVSGR